MDLAALEAHRQGQLPRERHGALAQLPLVQNTAASLNQPQPLLHGQLHGPLVSPSGQTELQSFFPVLSSIIEDNRDWIIDNVPGGDIIITNLERANAIMAYYGYGRLGIDGLRFAAGQLKGVVKASASSTSAPLSAEQHVVLQNINTNSQELLTHLEATEQAILAEQAAQQHAAQVAPPPTGGGGARPAVPPESAPPPPMSRPNETLAAKPPSPPAHQPAPARPPKPVSHEPAPVPQPAHEPAKGPTSTESSKAHESAEPNKPDPQTTAKPGDFTKEQLADANKRLEDRIADPRNVRTPTHETGYDLEVDLGDGQIYRRKPDGSWCLFRNPRLCGIHPESEVAAVAQRQVNRLETEAVIDEAVDKMVQANQLDRAKADAMREHLRENPEDLVRLLKMQGHPGVTDIALEHRIDNVMAHQPAMDPSTELAVREYLRTHPDRLEQLEALHSDTAAARFGTEDMPERGDATYGGSGPVEAGKEGKDLSRAMARKLNPGVPQSWIADELRFEFQMPDGTTRVTIPDIGMRSSGGSGFLIDSKFGPNATEQLLQQFGYPEIAAGRAVPVGPAATKFAKEIYPAWQPGTPMPATPVEIYNWRRVKSGTGEFGSGWDVTVDNAKYPAKP